jgi:hypothetical protein
MPTFSTAELAIFSRALERAILAVPGKPRPDILTSDLADAILEAAKQGITSEADLADRALESVLRFEDERVS